MKPKKNYARRSFDYEHPLRDIDYDTYLDLLNSGLRDSEIARELNISEKELKIIRDRERQDF
ncbi:hypothetical protein ABG79_00865 [Caloramator mitchellensis]|uniref:HTH luxR-type domain-containing protein n=1 Tax=Caloramator mitchellensis TaxID=908809 RepID=A0A0R3JVB6_CALMK|nr:hypothetical protein [Caloramator mitchellensis]KRQ87526.1 hypothetical protein ABG79_00865 [Caloramator mitchellensis]